MKKSFKTVISIILTAMLVLSLSSCSIFETMRENALKSQSFVPETSPDDTQLVGDFNKYLAASLSSALTIKESTSYSAGKPKITKDGESAGTLDAAAKQLKTFIMSAKPGKEDNWIKGAPADAENIKDIAQTLLKDIDGNLILELSSSRNTVKEATTDENGKEVKDESGNVIYTEKNNDNVIHMTFNYFDTVNLDGEEYATDENGDAAEETTVVYAEDNAVTSIFGEDLSHDEVLKNFENIENYITVKDYELQYTNCKITADADLGDGTLSFVKFQKEMEVTANAQGVGELADYGDIQVVFTLTRTVNYEFTYEETESELGEDTDVADVDTTVEDTSADESVVETESESEIDETVSDDINTAETDSTENENTVAVEENTAATESEEA